MEDRERIRKNLFGNITSYLFMIFADILLYFNLTTDRLGKKIITNIDNQGAFRLIVILGFLASLCSVYNIIFYYIISKKKVSAPIDDFFSTIGRKKIRQNYSFYFEEKYISMYKMYWKCSYLYLVIFVFAIIYIHNSILSK